MNPELIYTADVDAYGAGRHSLAPRCRSGELLRIRAGVYVPSRVWHQLSLWVRNRTRIRAAVERGPRSRSLIQQSAAPFWGLPVLGTSDSIMLLAVPPSHGRKRGDLRWTVRNLLEPVTEIAGVRLTSRAQTVLDMAAYLEFERAVPAMDHVLRPDPAHGLHALPKERLWELAEDLPGLTRQNRAKQVIDFADRRSESPGESYSRAMLHRHGFPEPELQQEFVTSAGRFRTDFFWKGPELGWRIRRRGEVRPRPCLRGTVMGHAAAGKAPRRRYPCHRRRVCALVMGRRRESGAASGGAGSAADERRIAPPAP